MGQGDCHKFCTTAFPFGGGKIYTSHPQAGNLLDRPVNYEIISKTEDESETTPHKNISYIFEITTNSEH